MLAAIGVVAVVGILQFSRVGAFDQKAGAFDEGRFVVTATTLAAAAAYAPIGSGLGTFATVYTAAEPAALLSPEYVNHAHNDWAELWLEGGVPIAVVLAAFLVWYALMGFRACMADDASIAQDVDLARAAFAAVGLLLIHSTVDYPLRTGAMMAVFGFACALLVPPQPVEVTEAGRGSPARGRRARRRSRQVDFIRPDAA
jgi:O-antigen ligase